MTTVTPKEKSQILTMVTMSTCPLLFCGPEIHPYAEKNDALHVSLLSSQSHSQNVNTQYSGDELPRWQDIGSSGLLGKTCDD